MSRWFRFYSDAVNDPKVQRLSGDTFKAWVNLLCLASRNNGVLPNEEDIAFALRLSGSKVTALLNDLQGRGLLDVTDEGTTPHNWDARQYRSDVTDPTAAERMRRHRNKRNADRNDDVSVTAPRAETEQNRTEAEQTAAVPDWLAIAEQACLAAKMKPGRAVNEISTATEWAKAGYDPALILDTIRKAAAKPGYAPPGGLAYFRTRIVETHALRRAPPPRSGTDWTPALAAWRADGTWLQSWGPKPGEAGCRVPANLLKDAA